jgi:LuxR family maltose regulon positive regulatory protein
LYQRLNQGLQSRLTLVSAPAGYGKTTLLAEWAASVAVPLAWLALDGEDNHPAGFFAYLWAALGHISAFPDDAVEPVVGDLSIQTALRRLILLLERADQPLILVLDDYHVIRSPEIHQALALFLDRLPPNLHLVIATRKDPPLPLARMRVRDELVEIRAEHLRFSQEESAQFLQEKMNLRLSSEDMERLVQRVEGWPAGLQLAGLSLQEQTDIHSRIQSISGNHPFILDYLVEEVLNTLPPEIQIFLLSTALLRRLNAPLCAAITGSSIAEAAQKLAYLEHANLFLTPLGAAREWFRYHHLFAELLQRRLTEMEGPERTADLHIRAAKWYHQSGEAVEAIYHALKSRSWSLAGEMMAHWGTEFFKTGAIGIYLPMLKALPTEALHRHPQLVQDLGWCLALTNDLEQADRYLRMAEATNPGPSNFLGETLAGQAYVACFRFDLERAFSLSRQALELIDPDYEWMRSVAAMVSGMAGWFQGDPGASEESMRMALQSARRAGSPRVEKVALAYLGRARVLEMDFLAAEEYALSAIGADPQPHLSPGNEVPAFDLAALYYEWNDLVKASHYLELGFAANEASGNRRNRVAGLRTLARVHLAQGQAGEAWKAAQQAVNIAIEIEMAPSFQQLNAACCAEVALALGNVDLADTWAGRIVSSDWLDAFSPLPRLAQARVWIARGAAEQAQRLLSALEQSYSSPAFRFVRFRIRLLQAAAIPQRAPALFGADLAFALEQKLARSFIDIGAPMAGILRSAASLTDTGLTDRAAAVIDACLGGVSTFQMVESEGEPLSPLVESLSERELSVLRAMAEGKPTSDIAAEMVVAVSTVRSHIKSIFAKLDVHNRLQAVDQARRRRII